MIIEDFLHASSRTTLSRSVEIDGLRDHGALEDAALLNIRMSAVWSDAWLLFDCKGALNIQEGNTAVLVARDVDYFSWTAEKDTQGRMNRAVERWEPASGENGWSLRALLRKNAVLTLRAGSSEFFVGDVPGGDDAPPNFVEDDDATIRAGLAGWKSEFEPYYMSLFDPIRSP